MDKKKQLLHSTGPSFHSPRPSLQRKISSPLSSPSPSPLSSPLRKDTPTDFIEKFSNCHLDSREFLVCSTRIVRNQRIFYDIRLDEIFYQKNGNVVIAKEEYDEVEKITSAPLIFLGRHFTANFVLINNSDEGIVVLGLFNSF